MQSCLLAVMKCFLYVNVAMSGGYTVNRLIRIMFLAYGHKERTKRSFYIFIQLRRLRYLRMLSALPLSGTADFLQQKQP